MNKYILFTALVAGILSATCQKVACGDVSTNEQNSDVSITITKFHVNDQNLELSWKIVNRSDHDVWICDSVSVFTGPDFEVYLSEDEQSLLIRRRLDVPTDVVWGQCPYGRYVLLRSGQERTESLSLAVPVIPRLMFAGGLATSDHARRLVLEIGFYNEDLPKLIRDILEMAEKLNCARLELKECSTAFFMRYFKGIWMAHWLFGGFEEYTYKEGMEGMEIPYTWQKFNGEQVLRATVNGVSIPYGAVPSADESTQSKTEPAGVTIALNGFDANDTKLELSWKIRNDSDHDVWVCDGYERSNGSICYFDRFMDKDNKTLVLRRRYNQTLTWLERNAVPRDFRYLRLSPGQQKVESHSFILPVTWLSIFLSSPGGKADFAQRLAIEIDFYDEDLRALILGVVDIAEKIGYDESTLSAVVRSEPQSLYFRFFGGFGITTSFKNTTYFRDSVTSDGDEILMPPMDKTLNGEQVLRIEVDNVSIPYKSNYPPLND